MKTPIDIKSVLCGVTLGVLAVFAIGAGTSSNPVGKYQVTAASAPNGTFFLMVDTQTGEAWAADSVANWSGSKPDKFWSAK
jgi:predicted cation transporter